MNKKHLLTLLCSVLMSCQSHFPTEKYLAHNIDRVHIKHYVKEKILPECKKCANNLLEYEECVRLELAKIMLQIEVNNIEGIQKRLYE